MTPSLSATWNETLVIDNIQLFDIGERNFSNFPAVVALLYDQDKRKVSFQVSPRNQKSNFSIFQMELLAASVVTVPIKYLHNPAPVSKKNLPINILPEKFNIREVFHNFVHQFPPHLRWQNFYSDGCLAAEVLMSAEMVELAVPTILTKTAEKNEPLPQEIRPDLLKFRIEVTFVGIRDSMKPSHFSSGRFKIELSMGELILTSGFSGKGFNRNLNFMDPYATGYLMLPKQQKFWPPVVIKHLDCSHKTPTVVGAAMIRRPDKLFVPEKPKDFQRFLLNQKLSNDEVSLKNEEVVEIEENEPLLSPRKSMTSRAEDMKKAVSKIKIRRFLQFYGRSKVKNPMTLEKEYTWWTKFYNSIRDEEVKNLSIHQITVRFI